MRKILILENITDAPLEEVMESEIVIVVHGEFFSYAKKGIVLSYAMIGSWFHTRDLNEHITICLQGINKERRNY